MTKRVYKSIIGIPVWMITGISLFIIFSAIYDWVVGDRSWSRYAILGSAGLIVLITIGMHFTKLKTVGGMARKQMGG